ncbi:FlgD immunoglobulin-like domain containing protein [Nocardioides sp.]|uniref:FlgD immunoglobulin-like domain containing protein n=1 Tax=Nocardioides sp. TaxID=35761 RepID=UPI003D0CA4EB
MKLRALLPVLVLASAGLAVPAEAADPPPEVTWPTISAINPDSSSYAFTVTDSGPGTLKAEWQGARQSVAQNGEHTMVFDTDGSGVITILRCSTETDCVSTGVQSPTIAVRRSLGVATANVDPLVRPGVPLTAELRITPAESTSVELTWHVAAPGTPQTDVASGSQTVTTDGDGRVSFPYTVPAATASGSYQLIVDATADVTDFGVLSGSSPARPFTIDADSPVPTLTVGATSFFPQPDGYRDTLDVTYGSDEAVSATLDVLNSSSAVVRTLMSGQLSAGASFTTVWNGRNTAGTVVPAGTYRVRIVVVDLTGNSTTLTRSVTVSDKKLVTKTYTRKFRAADTLIYKSVGSCSTLKKPSSHRWAGSLGLYSQTKCTKAAQSGVLTQHGIYIPKSVVNRYPSLQVTAYGGGSTTKTTKLKYLVMGYYKPTTGFAARVQFGAKVANHPGRKVAAGAYVFDKTTRPYVVWSAGLTDGSRYDLKSFTVKVSYVGLG